jgi:hypothetical protein
LVATAFLLYQMEEKLQRSAHLEMVLKFKEQITMIRLLKFSLRPGAAFIKQLKSLIK